MEVGQDSTFLAPSFLLLAGKAGQTGQDGSIFLAPEGLSVDEGPPGKPGSKTSATYQATGCYGEREIPGRDDATTPSGSRVISTVTPGRTEGTCSPVSLTTSPAKNLKM